VTEEVADRPDPDPRQDDVGFLALLTHARAAGRQPMVHVEDRIVEGEMGGSAGHVRAGSTIPV
jgi:hypothetical protein